MGAGPGDPSLITVAGLERLRRADAVVYDALANPRLLDEAPPHARRIDAGKRAREHRLTQDQTNALLSDLAREGLFVVRLKGGDPYLFGRGAEEAAYLARQGIKVEVIPGITSGIAAPMYAGIPVTHREHASSVTFITGHEDPTKPESNVDYAALAELIAAGGTACIYMGVGRLAAIRDALIAGALSPDTPVAVVQWGTLPRQRSVRGTLGTIADAVERAGVAAPAIIVVGAVAAIREPSLDFFTRRPLFGQTVLVTRTRQQASKLREQLEAAGAAVLEAPTIEVAPVDDFKAVDDALRRLADWDWLVLTSANAVDALADRLAALGLDARALAGVRVAVIGDATAQRLDERLRVRADFEPRRAVSEAFVEELASRETLAGRRALLLRADVARPALAEGLRAQGCDVTDLAIYETRLAAALPDDALAALREGRVQWVTFTSASTARNLVTLLGEERALLERVRIASIGPVTSEAVRELGLKVAVEAPAAGVEALAAAIVEASGGG